jgi:uncharacterized protein
MSEDLPPLVQRAIKRLIRAFAPERIILFGSYAEGTTHVCSDLNLLIVADLPGASAIHHRRARQLASDSFPRINVVLAAQQDATAGESPQTRILASILGTGVVVYRKT